MNGSRFFGLKLTVVALLFVSARAEAGYVGLTTTLDNLTPLGNYTTVGDKTFTFLSYNSTSSNGSAVAASAISVSALSGNSSNPVVPYGFQLTGNFSVAPNTSDDVSLAFTVTASAGLINQVNLFANGSTTGTGLTNVSESVFTLSSNGGAGTFLGTISVNGSGTASLNLAGYTSLYVTKDIAFGLGATGSESLSIIQQTFGETTNPSTVPEPASIAMFCLGLGLAGAYYPLTRSRRRADNN
jgi:hypothetical protein